MPVEQRILTTHVGSLPRPAELVESLRARHSNKPYEKAAFDAVVRKAVADAVAQQVAANIDIVSDGEMSKMSYSYYVQDRLEGLAAAADVDTTDSQLRLFQTLETVDRDFPDYAEFVARAGTGPGTAAPPVCVGPLVYRDLAPVKAELACLKASATSAGAPSCFMTAASPGVIAMFASRSNHYATEDGYVFALAEAMKAEYRAIYEAGVTLQVDCPDLALAPLMNYGMKDRAPHRVIARNIEALNNALEGIPGDAVRVHVCWGNHPGPHAHDLEVRELFPHFRSLKARAISFEAANPRHEHEWEDWKDAGLPDDMVLIPGLIDSTTNFVEHPRLVAQRVLRFAEAVGRERVIAGVDCGFGTFAAQRPHVFPTVVWAKLKSLSEGARMASDKLRKIASKNHI
jgi:5-methyltetrahydropteroyltriglutamate--homocysteine methyltransferase